MKRKLKLIIKGIILTGIPTAVLVGLIGFEIYLWTKYAGTPMDEIPKWVLWFMFKG